MFLHNSKKPLLIFSAFLSLFLLYFPVYGIYHSQVENFHTAVQSNEFSRRLNGSFQPKADRQEGFSQAIEQTQDVKICLTMIVKNESAIIERCLNHVKDIVDVICICDTGSTDNTVEIIEEFMQKHGIPGQVYHQPWKNFGHNRTLSRKAAQKTLTELDFSLENTYLLFLDADMILVTEPEFDKNTLTDDAYLLTQKDWAISYQNLRLARASMPWESIGVTHEYWSCPFSHQTSSLNTLIIDDWGDGGAKADKFERDIRLLKQGLEEQPNNERYMFYLAQSYKSLHEFEEAIKWYQIRIDRGGWKEEIWYAKYMIGQCYEELSNWKEALLWYFEAYNYNPERGEPLYKIASYYRHRGENDLAYLFAKQGSAIPYPSEQVLFIEDPVYNYQFDEEISIAGYYTSSKEDGFNSLNKLLLKKNVPEYVKNGARHNLLFYVQNLKNATFEPIVIDLPKIREGFSPCYNPMNPSIQKVDDGYMLICRTVNYIQIGGMNHKSVDIFDSTIRTKNFFVHYDKHFNVLSQHEIVDNVPRYRKKDPMVTGLEDCHLLKVNDDFWFTCSGFDLNPDGIPKMALCKLASETSEKEIEVEKLVPLKGPDQYRCEKNWLPFVKDNEIHLIYSCDPYIIYKPDLNTGDCKEVVNYLPKHDFSSFRGSAAPIKFDDGYLMVIHEVGFTDQRYYFHRFVYLDKEFNITKISKPFTFLHLGIEYTCGMTIDHTGTQLIISIGLEDSSAYLCTVDIATVRSMLDPLP